MTEDKQIKENIADRDLMDLSKEYNYMYSNVNKHMNFDVLS
jgi:hypothetical protein